MLIQRSKVVLNENNQNVLVEDFTENYEGIEALNGPQSVMEVMNEVFHLSDMAEEYFYLVCMNTKNRPISFFEVAHGGCDKVLVGMREIFVRALLCGASCFVIVHNHPSGIPDPSDIDINFTKRVWDTAQMVGITFCDHIIIGRDFYYSFKEKGRMELWE